MTKSKTESTSGELFVSILLASVAAVPAGIVGFVGAFFLCGRLFSGEMTEWGLMLAPITALVFAALAFVAVFRWFDRYGEIPSSEN